MWKKYFAQQKSKIQHSFRIPHSELRILLDSAFNLFLPFDKAFEDVADLHGADAGGCAGEDIVAFLKGEIAGDMADKRIELENHIGAMAVLYQFPVFMQLKMNILPVAQFVQRHKSAEGCRAVETLGDFPGLAFLLEFVLHIAGRKINPESQGVVVALGKFGLYGTAVFTHPQHQFAFVVQVFGEVGIIKGPVGQQQGGGRLHEDQRLRRHRVVELFGVVDVIATNTENFHRHRYSTALFRHNEGRNKAGMQLQTRQKLLYGEFQHAATAVEHEDETDNKKQDHAQIKHEITFAACILDIFHNPRDA